MLGKTRLAVVFRDVLTIVTKSLAKVRDGKRPQAMPDISRRHRHFRDRTPALGTGDNSQLHKGNPA
jgi:hypothetical protein